MTINKVKIDGLETQQQLEALKQRLLNMIGVSNVEIDLEQQQVNIEFETPTNLNSIEKEIYDDGYKVLN
ncbi:putative copper chaperone CsoZ [Staphylococcus caledonicus]|uniref:putative copper chaperone CsoZ n=1 Tax=Staphylococcus caledonicus TaxID=2741333 RepID=UPI0018E44D5F|nr:heavy metal-associated domain-containing protein [Staphylococcus caledonicus]MBI5973842.1 heavy-metal-associated domain-containing protein [Staphylococcus caledonicus]